MRIGLRRPRAILDARINLRAERLFRDGLLEEVAVLLTAGHGPELAPMTGHGYAEAARVLRGEWPLERAVSVTALRTRQYARRQETWFRRDPSIQWLELGEKAADDPVFVDRALGYARELRATEG